MNRHLRVLQGRKKQFKITSFYEGLFGGRAGGRNKKMVQAVTVAGGS